MILGRYLLTALVLDIEFYDNAMVVGDGLYEGFSAAMVGISNYDFTSITDKTVKPEEFLLTCTSTNA